MNKIFTATMFLLLIYITGLGQTSYWGLTPGKSTKADVARVLGQAVKQVSGTLIEYREPEDVGKPEGIDKIYVQYRDESVTAVVERIELVCDYPGRAENRPDGCANFYSKITRDGGASVRGRVYADRLEKESSGVFKTTAYYGSPVRLVRTWSRYPGKETIQSRLGLYSVDLFDSVVPKNCTGTFLGEWETNRGRLILTDIPGAYYAGDWGLPETKGTFSMHNGTVTGRGLNTLTGEWKDATGSGTFELKIDPGSAFEPTWPDPRKVFTGTWERTSGKGPKKGTWEGRCVNS